MNTYSYANFQGVNMQLGWKHSNTLGVQENKNLYSQNRCDNSITLCFQFMNGTNFLFEGMCESMKQ